MKLGNENNIRMNFGHKQRTVCFLCRWAEDTWAC